MRIIGTIKRIIGRMKRIIGKTFKNKRMSPLMRQVLLLPLFCRKY